MGKGEAVVGNGCGWDVAWWSWVGVLIMRGMAVVARRGHREKCFERIKDHEVKSRCGKK